MFGSKQNKLACSIYSPKIRPKVKTLNGFFSKLNFFKNFDVVQITVEKALTSPT